MISLGKRHSLAIRNSGPEAIYLETGRSVRSGNPALTCKARLLLRMEGDARSAFRELMLSLNSEMLGRQSFFLQQRSKQSWFGPGDIMVRGREELTPGVSLPFVWEESDDCP